LIDIEMLYYNICYFITFQGLIIMPHQCNGHSHGGKQEDTADIFTNANSVIGGATSFLSMLFFVARLVDTFGDYEKRFAEMSYPAIATGFAIALYAAIGSTICHRALNKQNQGERNDEHSESNHTHPEHTGINTQPVSADDRTDDLSRPILQPTSSVEATQLTNWQRLWLLADFIGHASDVASPILFILLYAFEMQKYQKAISYGGSFALGLFSSVASVRTCRNALLNENKKTAHGTSEEQHEHHHCDGHGHSHA
jgi:hypothetical protein